MFYCRRRTRWSDVEVTWKQFPNSPKVLEVRSRGQLGAGETFVFEFLLWSVFTFSFYVNRRYSNPTDVTCRSIVGVTNKFGLNQKKDNNVIDMGCVLFRIR